MREPVGERERRKKRGLKLHWIPPCGGAGSVGRGGDRGGRLVKAPLKVPRILQQPTQIDHRVSVVLPDCGERLTFFVVDGFRRWRSGHRLAVRVGCDAAHDTDTPTCFEVLGDLGTDVRRVGRLASGLWVDALKPGLVGAGGVALVTVVGDAAGGPLGAAPKLPLESAGGDKAEPVRARLRERVSSGLSPPSARLAGVAGHKFSFFPVAGVGWVVLILPCGSDSVFGHGPSARAQRCTGLKQNMMTD